MLTSNNKRELPVNNQNLERGPLMSIFKNREIFCVSLFVMGKGVGGGIRNFDKMINFQRIPKIYQSFFGLNFFFKTFVLRI